METKLNFVLQFKNISQMQANKNFPGSSQIGFLWCAKQIAVVASACKNHKGTQGLVVHFRGSADDLGFTIVFLHLSNVYPSHAKEMEGQCHRPVPALSEISVL